MPTNLLLLPFLVGYWFIHRFYSTRFAAERLDGYRPVVAAPNLEPHDTFVALIPFFSGYRDNSTLQLRLTTDYLGVYESEGLDPKEFRVVIPVSSIRMASLFDHSVYPKFEVVEDESA